jgi:heat shock protein HslJ
MGGRGWSKLLNLFLLESNMKSSIKIVCLTFIVLVGCASVEETTQDQSEVFSQVSDQDYATLIAGKYWKLVKLGGQNVVMSEAQEREAHFILKAEENRLTGFSGCNTFFGFYSLDEGKRIHFDQVGSTRRACPDVQLNEYEFLQVFNLADTFSLNGDTLVLSTEDRTQLAVFQAIYFQ